ncbi:hypothetical protein BV25DRAFT_1819689 [Artomyces pyxidatus]|uniref:Uncharacterized protein n=1 Tax=Artomyces pyxidatus TaxID=48021 RepID=A0ACB8TFY6_9AGAM|nr:hypothetical protein BV25DRAFT_1819689 [Artomyces pyxidatus]
MQCVTEGHFLAVTIMSQVQSSVPTQVLQRLSQRSRTCIERLGQHEPEIADLHAHPVLKLAAVLVLLYERAGELRVLLTTRSKALRSHPGQTALPGGKVDDTDKDVFQTAYREAYEEVGLPLNSPHVHAVCTLRPFVSAYKILVTPVVALLDELSVLDELVAEPGEVAHIFDHPLEALLDPAIALKEPLEPIGSEHWPYDVELHSWSDIQVQWLNNTTYRMHRFRSAASPVKGLTSDILILAAEIAYDQKPVYERWGADQLKDFGTVFRVLQESISQEQQPAPQSAMQGSVAQVATSV